MKDRRNASQIKNINMFKRMGRGKGNWGTELDAQMALEFSENEWEMETESDVSMTVAEVAVVKGEEVASKSATDATEEKPEDVEIRRNKKGYRILEIERNFGLTATQKQAATKENQQPAAESGDDSKKESPDTSTAPTKEAGSEVKTPVKSQEELQKAAALRFKQKGPAWGKVAEAVKKVKLSPIKEELKQKCQ